MENKKITKIHEFNNENDKHRFLILGRIDFVVENDIIFDVNINIDSFIMEKTYSVGLNKCYNQNKDIKSYGKEFKNFSEVNLFLDELIMVEYQSLLNTSKLSL